MDGSASCPDAGEGPGRVSAGALPVFNRLSAIHPFGFHPIGIPLANVFFFGLSNFGEVILLSLFPLYPFPYVPLTRQSIISSVFG